MMNLMIPKREEFDSDGEFYSAVSRSMSEGDGGFTFYLNRMLDRADGDDTTIFNARINAQCEIHCYVEGPDREWLAKIIEAGRIDGGIREGAGWESVIQLLRERNDQPVVCSYAVTDQFPNMGVCVEAETWEIPDDGELDWDDWYDLSPEDQWERGMFALRHLNKTRKLRLDPETWKTFRWGATQ